MVIKTEQLAEINQLRLQKNTTLRPVSPELEEVLYQPFEVLDHGFVRVVDYMGNDSSVVQSARVSYGAGTKKVNADMALINYLMAHRHTTPFEMCEIKFHIKLPIFVARQWIRHRTASVNEYSARYSIMEDEFYIPKGQHLSSQSKINHQGRDETKILNESEQKKVLEILKKDSATAYKNYLEMINQSENGEVLDSNKEGLARELARMNLPLNCYTQWYWKIDLHNLLHFLNLRADSHAQYEIRVYAEIMLDIVKKWVPQTYQAFIKNNKTGKNFSGPALEIIKKMLKGEKISQENSGLSTREWGELMQNLDIKQ
ncbi:MAG: FAD-dependent thymidylate synthase [Proteobacteria bacterium]|nr:FAD-dependent thymidylate synthase [Pseudomonadota bacterium]NCA28678.1 FAD-dependent thymidylate synthase [Pseudomonadota bacterium]